MSDQPSTRKPIMHHAFTPGESGQNQSMCMMCGATLEQHTEHLTALPQQHRPEDHEQVKIPVVYDVQRKKVPICAWCETEFPGTHLPGSRMLKLHRCEPMMRHMADAAVARREQLGAMIDPKYRRLGVGNYHDNPVEYYIKEETARRIDDGEKDPEEHHRMWFDRKLD